MDWRGKALERTRVGCPHTRGGWGLLCFGCRWVKLDRAWVGIDVSVSGFLWVGASVVLDGGVVPP